jgi:hypothetical protein
MGSNAGGMGGGGAIGGAFGAGTPNGQSGQGSSNGQNGQQGNPPIAYDDEDDVFGKKKGTKRPMIASSDNGYKPVSNPDLLQEEFVIDTDLDSE